MTNDIEKQMIELKKQIKKNSRIRDVYLLLNNSPKAKEIEADILQLEDTLMNLKLKNAK